MVAMSALKKAAAAKTSNSMATAFTKDNNNHTAAAQSSSTPALNNEMTVDVSAKDCTSTNAAAKTTTQLHSSPPPLKFIDIDPNQRLPLPTPLPNKELLKKAEEVVYWAISSKHENSAVNQLSSTADNNNDNSNNHTNNRNKAIEATRQHALLTDLLSRKHNPTQLLYTLHALISSNSGNELDRLVTHPKLHAQLLHLLLRLDPFTPGVDGGNMIRELQSIRKLEKRQQQQEEQEHQQQEQQLQQQQQQQKKKKKSVVTIDESAIQHKIQYKYLSPTQPYYNYQIANIYLHLIISLISNNSILCVSAVRSIWGLLTDFGGRWMEDAMRRMEGRRKWRRRLRMGVRRRRELEKLQRQQQQEQFMLLQEQGQQMEGNGDDKDDDENDNSPLHKRQRVDDKESSLLTTPTTPPAAVSIEKQLAELGTDKEDLDKDEVFDDEPEGERIVPGMSGLTVDFVKDVFFPKAKKEDNGGKEDGVVGGNDSFSEEEEIICSDRLASGRVHRLLLTLLNIFRLCPRSKSDLLREISNNFPHYKTCPPALYQWYSHICLQLLHLVPTMEGPIMSMFVDKALDMDVEIKIDDKGGVFLDSSAGNNGDGGGGGVVEYVNNSTDESNGAGVVTTTSPLPKKRSFQYLSQDSQAISATNTPNNSAVDTTAEDESDHINEIAERLDTLMTVLYEHIIHATTFSPDSLSEAMMAAVNARKIYRHLDEVFDKKVRTTDRSKFVQFVFFVLFGRENDALEAVGRLMAKRGQVVKKDVKNDSSIGDDADADLLNHNMDPLYRGFSARLIDVFFNPSYAGDVPRQTVVCYLASFVSRAKYVCPETVCECIAALLRWAEIYVVAQQESQKKKGRPTLRRSASSTLSLSAQQQPCEVHGLFYTSCQAAFYLMCFRGVEAIQYYRNAFEHRDDPDSPYADPESVDIGPQRWRFLCSHELQPLKYCLESVRLEFLHIAEDLDLFLDQGEDDELPRREESKAFLDGLWNSISKEGRQETTTKMKPNATPARRRSTIISTAAIQEKKRLDGGVGGLGKGSNPLGSFFPFDPYLLQKSYEHIHPYYRNWEDCIPTSSLDAEEDEIDVSADMSDIEDDEVDDEQVEEEEEDDDDDNEDEDEEEDEDEDDHSKADANTTAKQPSSSTLNDESFDVDFRRSRALSTGSQCSW